VKSNQRFDLRRLSEQLVERGLVDRNALQHVLHQSQATGILVTEMLVRDGLVSDWEIGRVSCELFHLPYLPVERYSPQPIALDGLEAAYLRRFCIVPLDRWGTLLTVAMPGIVPTEVLEGLRGTATRVMPVVGSVTGNRKWLLEHLPDAAAVKAGQAAKGGAGKTAANRARLELVDPALPAGEDAWADIFDAGDKSVHHELKLRQPGSDS
jgi:hypothetical protein